jgi:hypothetical protein
MSKHAKLLLVRQSDDGEFEVENTPGHWIKCESKADAKILSEAPVLEASWLNDRRIDKDNIQKIR